MFTRSPQYHCEPLSEDLRCTVTLKVETINPIRSFKGRGADHFLDRARDDRTIVCASAGNFGQAMAYACRRRARPLIVYASRRANPLKLYRMRTLGAEVRSTGVRADPCRSRAER